MRNIIDLIGNTPLISLGEINCNEIYAKLEYYNPSGSVKDRAALFMIKGAVKRGELQVGGTIIEPTSGNTGIGLALIGAQMGFKVILTMPSTMSVERQQILRALGAELVLTDGARGMQGAVDKAIELKATIDGAYVPMQFENVDGMLAHFKTTAPEIFGEVKADYVVCGVGSGGTAMGIKQYIVNNNIKATVVAVQPSESPLLTGGVAAGHGIQGIGANFIPKLVDLNALDKIVNITTAQSYEGARELTAKFGILSGISGGAAYMAAKSIAEGTSGKKIVFIVPDNALKYLSNNIYG